MRIWKNTGWNLLGVLIPTLFAIPGMAVLARQLDVERFGLFMLAFSIVGFASIFDAGISRAVIRAVAMNARNLEKEREILGTATYAVLALSVFASIVMFLATPNVVSWLNVSEEIKNEVIYSFKWLTLILPLTIMGIVWFSFLEGRQDFHILNIYKILTGILVAILPPMFLYFDSSLFGAVIGLLAARAFSFIIAIWVCVQSLGNIFRFFQKDMLLYLLGFGGWITISNILSPIMSYVDRFLLSHIFGANQVAFYASPSDAVHRMGVIPGSLARVIFPLFSSDQENSRSVASLAYKATAISTLAIIIPVAVFSEELLNLWLGVPYGEKSSTILRILVFGFAFNAMAQIPFSRIQAHGHSKITAIIHMIEVLPYIALLWLLAKEFGLIGAAIAWSSRVIIDFLVLEYCSRKMKN